MTNQEPDNSHLVQRVLDRIAKEKISVRSRLSIFAERLGLDSIGVVMFLVAILAVSLVLFWAKAGGMFSYFQFGPVGVQAFFEAFPYQWFAIAALALVVVAGLLRHVAEEHRAPVRLMIGGFTIVIVGLGVVCTLTGMNDRLADSTLGDKMMVHGLTEHHGQSGLVGQVIGISPDSLRLIVGNETVVVRVNRQTNMPAGQIVVPGDRILVVSQQARGGDIEAAGIRKLQPIYTVRQQAHWRLIDAVFVHQSN